ncbi:uncharacterized protein Dvir_GJ12133, isoform C [Drosophila virilis]|uniref:Uncharacterized protein, isoform C n=1 Tax=Drosophila virilis TaxID=7244 RepID=A0A0Q9WJ37_DROVI|nr:uncharacterized protein LOC6622836 isoform X7 [Drosophila virilis]KRF84354.1 uncharacterized protein Dvir_GJ12133, isoform C [Drosophila virilis]
MAAVQRKLVHKQFNSPMGLYSQENVKATLNRELKAFGADGIEIDDQITKPLNLANSAVLRAVEEEEQQIKCGDIYARPRQSRTRQRDVEGPNSPVDPPHHALHQQLLDQIKTQYLSHQHDVVIDRDTVLRINRMSTTRRHLLRRDHSWPPVEQEAAGIAAAHSVTPSPTHSIDVLREKFNSPTRIVEPSPREVRQQRLQLERSASPKQQKLRITPPPTPKPPDEPLGSSCRQTPKAKGFSAPETKAADSDIGLVAPKCEYYEQLTNKRTTTPTLKPSNNYRPRLKRQSYSLDRGRARKRAVALGGGTELPPLKPRNGSGSGNGTPKVQRRSIKLATELKISYDTDTANDGDSEEEPKAAVDIDLETLPLPATPSEKAATAAASAAAAAADTAKLMTKSLPIKAATVIDSLALKQQQQMAVALATAAFDAQSSGGRIIPVTVTAETSRSAHPGQLLGSVQQIYDDACSYLHQDQQQHQQQQLNMTPPTNTEDASLPATYVSATKGIKLQRQDSAPRLKPQGSHQSCIPTPPPLPPPPPLLQLRAKTRQEAKDMQAHRQGGIYDSNLETLPALAKQHEAHVEIAQLEAKYAHIQQSITEHLRQIDAYMENAKTALQRTVQPTPTPTAMPTEPPPAIAAAKPLSSGNHNNNELWDMFASRQSPILAVESPLQAILRQIYCRAAGIQLLPKEQVMPDMHLQPVMPTENVPIVERALEDLHKIAIALDSDEHALLHVEHKTTPTAAKAQHVVIAEEEEQQQQQQDTTATAEEEDVSLDYRHVSDVIANYEQLSTGKAAATTQRQELPLGTDKQDKQSPINQLDTAKHQEQQESIAQKSIKEKEELGEGKEQLKEQQQQAIVQPEKKLKEQQSEAEAEQTATPGCPHEPTATEDILGGGWCAICGECRASPHGWGKLTKADQWRFDNLQNEPLANYKSTYEIRSPYVSRQISWEDTQQQQQPREREPKEQLQRQRSVVEIVTTPVATVAPAESKEWRVSRSPSPLPYRRYPAPLIDTAQRCISPFGLNAVQTKSSTAPSPTPMEAKYTHVSQLEGHNIGLLVSTATEPLQLSMSASSSLLAATPPTTPRCNSQPPPFEFLLQHGLGAQEQSFKSLAGSEERLREFSLNRSFDNVSPRPYIGIEGYKRVAWPPASEERIVREFTPQPPTQSPAPGSGGYYPQSAGQPVSSAAPAQAQFNRQPSREPVQAPAASYPQQQQRQLPPQQQQQYQPTYQQQQQPPIHAVDNAGAGWKHIGAPAPKTHSDFNAGGVAPATAYAPYQQQQQQLQQQQYQQQHYLQQYICIGKFQL